MSHVILAAPHEDDSQKKSKLSSETRKEMNAGGLPINGKSRWGDIKHMIPVSHEKWAQMAKCGKGPPITRYGLRCSFQDNDEILAWLNDPNGYKPKGGPIDFHSTLGQKS
ncbi:hypothetical protein M2128_002249 [Polynucleobacter sphagniphilus]|jgi:hypothetical protein|uniref:hypothetical protein n=1 Tax=Polynucleobacter sphagniphilus TaxID=1743169 RepID=UPI0024743C2A|nr:hypothetical protein [Polynucleobacter sphagniphilus]MDH6303302.1 hypothetical protein [Polynucleobacter sphagniphilus]